MKCSFFNMKKNNDLLLFILFSMVSKCVALFPLIRDIFPQTDLQESLLVWFWEAPLVKSPILFDSAENTTLRVPT